jgi:ABC-2 type transport system permease protein
VKLLAAHVRAETLGLLRYPAFSAPTLLFPAIFFLLAVSTRPALTTQEANLFLASFVGFATLGVAFFQFGVGIAVERTHPWEAYLRTLPITPRVRFGARVVSALEFGLASAGVLAVVSVVTTPVELAPSRWLLLAVVGLLGSIPFALLGIALGYWSTPRGALPIANILFLGLSFVGGLWTTPEDLPSAIRDVSKFVPTHQFADVLWGAATGDASQPRSWLLLSTYALVFGAIARFGYLRDEGERFR